MPVPHPNNFLWDGKPAQQDGYSDGAIGWIPYESPTVLVVANFGGKPDSKEEQVSSGGTWHIDIEYKPLPIYVSMFLAHVAPVTHDSASGTWVEAPADDDPHPYSPGSNEELTRLRRRMPLNGETAFADTAGAFTALASDEQERLEQVRVRRRLNEGDEGWLASRPGVRPSVEVEGMSMQASRVLLDKLKAHVLQPRFRYDHAHEPGDVTIWDNYMTLHNTPPMKANVSNVDDARLLCRLSCKGALVCALPRCDDPAWLATHVTAGYTTPSDILAVD